MFSEIPNLDQLLVPSMHDVLEHAEILVVATGSPEFREVIELRRPGQRIIDLARIVEEPLDDDWYHGICW